MRHCAELKGFAFAGDYEFVPGDALAGIEVAEALGIFGEHDLFGGVVPRAFVATKVIPPPLVEVDADTPTPLRRSRGDVP